MVAAQVHVEPADDDRHGAESAHGDEVQGCILHVVIRVHGEKNGEAGDGNGDRHKGEGKAVPGSVGNVGNDHSEDEGACPRWHAMELRPDLTVAVGSDDARGEESVTKGFVPGQLIIGKEVAEVSCGPTHP